MRTLARSLLATAFVAAVSLFGASASAQMKMAVVDVQRAVMQSEDGLRAQATLKKVFDSRQQELNKRQTDLQKQKEEIDKQKTVLSQAALQKKVDDWQKEMVELQQTFVEYNKELEKKQKELTDPIFERVLGAIKRIAGTDGYDLIVDRATVAFARGDLDLTDRVIQISNGGTTAPGPAHGWGRAGARASGAREPEQAVMWDGIVRLEGRTLQVLAEAHGGRVLVEARRPPTRVVPVERAEPGDLAPLLSRRFVKAAIEAAGRGAALLVDASVIDDFDVAQVSGGVWVHEHATWAMAELLDGALVPDAPAVVGPGCRLASSAVLGPRVVIGARVVIGPGVVIGHPGFGWALRAGAVRPVPQLGGVVIEDDVVIGPLSTVDAGTLGPTRIRRGAKLDAHVHVGHNGDIGEGTIIAAQCGFAGSVTIGRGVLVGGQVGVADHVTIGDGARIAAKSGVIGDVPAGATYAGYPAVPRMRWLRAFARMYEGVRRDR